MSSATNKPVALVVGASRGIGRQVAIDLAKAGYHVIVSAKSTTPLSALTTLSPFPPDPNSSKSTITTVALEITNLGHSATAIPVDTTSQTSIENLINETFSQFGRIDVLIYNTGAIWWGPIATTPLKKFLLLQKVNPEGLYTLLHHALPALKASPLGGRIIVVCPPIYSRFFRGKTAYAMGKVAMSVLVKGLGMDFVREDLTASQKKGEGREKGMAITGIWPAVAIESAATEQFTTRDEEYKRDLRKPAIFSDAILAMLEAKAERVNGELLLDEDFLREEKGVQDFGRYSLVEGASPRRIMPEVLPDLRVKEQDDEGMRADSSKL
ncbi:putative short chain dehydrogenase family protein [Triangularia verruculosa]|uniref:Short chain dehydrogenase family protein n=1 Tax=Triangularia verruculosa TaxID=2587418 RepID=A0AAN6XN98_9PEZI|nr:putative short chain dehydrogenase family protein [Triangularia verruculosa]